MGICEVVKKFFDKMGEKEKSRNTREAKES